MLQTTVLSSAGHAGQACMASCLAFQSCFELCLLTDSQGAWTEWLRVRALLRLGCLPGRAVRRIRSPSPQAPGRVPGLHTPLLLQTMVPNEREGPGETDSGSLYDSPQGN